MDLFELDKVKEEKTSALMLGYNRLRSVAKLFRFVELCLALVLLLWIFTRLPFAVRISGEYFRQLAGIVASPLFVFLLCNGIIGALFAKSRGFSAETELYEELIKNSENRAVKSLSADSAAVVAGPLSREAEEIVFQDKEIICCQENGTAISISRTSENDIEKDSDSNSELDSDSTMPYRRTKSEKLNRESSEMAVDKLRRSETEKFMKSLQSDANPEEDLLPGEDLSDEEFQKAIDAFIAKHLKFRRQESIAIVVPNQA